LDQRLEFIGEWLERERPVAELSRIYGVSRKTAYKWLERFRQSGRAGLADRSRATHHSPQAMDEETAAAIGVSFPAFQSMLGSIFLMPLDMSGAPPAGFSKSLLALVAAATHVLVSPAIGAVVDHPGFTVLCAVVPLLPLLGLGILQTTLRATPAGPLPPHAR